MSIVKVLVDRLIGRVEAPKWFAEEYNKCEKMLMEVNSMLGITEEDKKNILEKFPEMGKGKIVELEEFLEMMRLAKQKQEEMKGKINYNKDLIDKVRLGQEMFIAYRSYIWKKLRYEMSGTRFSSAKTLHYNQTDNFIEITK